MVTDPNRMRRKDPGNPDICNVFTFHKLYSGEAVAADVAPKCRKAEIGCVECKKLMARHLVEAMAPQYERRLHYEAHPEIVEEVIRSGSANAREEARETMAAVRDALKIKL
jgi:tryptophanyl-tRNA synthetase